MVLKKRQPEENIKSVDIKTSKYLKKMQIKQIFNVKNINVLLMEFEAIFVSLGQTVEMCSPQVARAAKASKSCKRFFAKNWL